MPPPVDALPAPMNISRVWNTPVVDSRCPRSIALKPAVRGITPEKLPTMTLSGDRQGAERVGIGPLERGDDHGGHPEQGQGAEDGELGVQRPTRPSEAAGPQVDQHGEAETADDHEQGDRDQDEGVAGEADQVVGEQGEAGVVPRRHRMEHAEARGVGQRGVVGPGEPGGENDRPDRFGHRRHGEDALEHDAQLAEVRDTGLGQRRQPLAQPHPARQQHGEQGGGGS